MTDSKALLLAWIDAFNRHDVDALVECYTPEAVNFQVAAGGPRVGTDDIRADFESFFSAFPDTYARVENILADGNWAAWEWLGGGTLTGEFLGFDPTKKSYELRGCGFFQFQNEKIILQRGYWDKETWFSQIGITEGA